MAAQRSTRRGFSFFGMVGGVMALLKVKESYDQYKQVNADDEEHQSRVAMNVQRDFLDEGVGEGPIALVDTELPGAKRSRKKRSCCMCCGFDCSLFWKAIAIVLALSTLYYGFKALRWAFTDAPTGLEGMPAYSTSLGCMDAPHIYNGSQVTVMAPIGTSHNDHSFDSRGGAVGTFTLADGDANAKEVKYQLTLRTNDESLLKDVYFDFPELSEDNVVSKSRVVMTTPHIAAGSCMRFDITMYVPPNLKKLHVASHSTAHVTFSKGSTINTDDLFVTLFSLDSNNLILPREEVASKNLVLEVNRGWIVGDASILRETSITTQRGDGVANVKVHPAPPSDSTNPEAAIFRTTTGAGRSDFSFHGHPGYKRPIDSTHTSSRNADMYLTYRDAEFNGKIEMTSKSYTVTNAQRLVDSPRNKDLGDDEDTPKWTHFSGDKDGGDKIYVNSRGWTGLYF
ncbi:hypothetical protein B0H34DRAFT_795544 [Crassisporium funariophilum]|nr:hypothetical protein B0H34DRAFT_795544 [Crassisporium funariophilum]